MADDKKTKLSWMDYFKMLVKGRSALEAALNEGKVVADAASTAGIKTAGFWMTALASLGAVAAQVGGLIPPPWGGVALAVSGLAYAISRGLVKRDDSIGGLKPAMATSEAWQNILGALAQMALSLSGTTSPEHAAVLAAVHAAAISAAQSLAASGAQPEERPNQPPEVKP